MVALDLRGVTKRFERVTAVDRFSLSVEEGEFVVLLGPSGCGKTTTLRLLAGFEPPDEGTIAMGGREVASRQRFVPAQHRRTSVVFQNYALWPHMTVHDNVAFGLRLQKGVERGDIEGRVNEMLALVQLQGFGERYPHQLSGGQQQRVAFARALVADPVCLLLDEPLSNLDTRLREDMRYELRRLQRVLNLTTVYVTHDQTEALALADRVAVMNAGRIEQVGPPETIYRHPRTPFVALALGATNFVTGTVLASGDASARVRVFDRYELDAALPEDVRPRKDATVTISVRPSGVAMDGADVLGESPMAEVKERLFLGDHVQYLLAIGGLELKATGPMAPLHEVGERVALSLDPDVCSVLAPSSDDVSEWAESREPLLAT